MNRRILIPVLLLCMSLCVTTGCARGATDDGSSSDDTGTNEVSAARLEPPPATDGGVWGGFPRAEKSDSAQQAPPGLRELPRERAQVIGTLDYRDIDGGSYCIVSCYPWDDIAEAEVLAVVATEEPDGLRGLFEAYVSADGALSTENDLPILAIDDVRSVGDADWDLSWNLASREKPNGTSAGDTFRAVGTLVFVEQYREVRTDSWAVVDALDPEVVKNGVGSHHVVAFVDESAFAGEMPEAGTYVEASGPQVDSKLISGSRWPVIQVAQIDAIP